MTYEIYIPSWLFAAAVIYLVWFLLPLLFRVKSIMVGERKKQLPWIILSLIISAAFLLTTLFVRGMALVFYTMYEWSMALTVKMLGAIISDEKS